MSKYTAHGEHPSQFVLPRGPPGSAAERDQQNTITGPAGAEVPAGKIF